MSSAALAGAPCTAVSGDILRPRNGSRLNLSIAVAFALSSAVSVALVVSYLRLVVSTRFAFVEAGIAQLVYLIGFSLAHFWEGYTGLTVTVLSIVTLFLLMQLTGRIRWSALADRLLTLFISFARGRSVRRWCSGR